MWVVSKNELKIDSDWPNQRVPNFNKRILKIFRQYETSDKDIKGFRRDIKKIELRKYQKIAAKYLKMTPYRGLLIYHGLGSGKTFTASNVILSLDMDTVIMLPASLKSQWYERYINKYFMDFKKKIYYISYNASNLYKQYQAIDMQVTINESINNFDNKLIIIDESHEFFQNVISGKARQASQIFKLLMSANNCKFLFLTGTPIVNDPFELVPMFVLLRGQMGRSPSKPQTNRSKPRQLKNYNIFPDKREEFNNLFLKNGNIINENVFIERIIGLVSFYSGAKDPDHIIIPRLDKLKIIKCEMSSYQKELYDKARSLEEKIEKFYKHQRAHFKVQAFKKPVRESKGIYRINTSKICNFVFPKKVEKIYDEIRSLYYDSTERNLRPGSWKIIEKHYGISGDWPKKFEIAEIKWQIMVSLFNFDEILRTLPILSGKLNKLFNMIRSDDHKTFIYSNMKILGSRIIGKLLESSGYLNIKSISEYKSNKKNKRKAFVVVDGDVKNKQELVDMFNDPENLYGEYCRIIIGTTVLSRGIDLMHVRKLYILEPSWKQTTIYQTLYRTVRLFSHEGLEKSEKNVQPYIFLSFLPKIESTDIFLYKHGLKKQKLNDKFLDLLKRAAMDCYLNTISNAENGKKINCYTCDTIREFPADINQHITYGSICSFETTTDIKYTEILGRKGLFRDSKGNVYDKSKKKIGSIVFGDIIQLF